MEKLYYLSFKFDLGPSWEDIRGEGMYELRIGFSYIELSVGIIELWTYSQRKLILAEDTPFYF